MHYILLIYADESVDQKVHEKEFPEWMDYSRRLNEAGVMLSGEALQPTKTATTLRGKAGANYDLTDGPYAEMKEALAGFYMINVDNLDEAEKCAAQIPSVKRGGKIEIRPIMEIDKG